MYLIALKYILPAVLLLSSVGFGFFKIYEFGCETCSNKIFVSQQRDKIKELEKQIKSMEKDHEAAVINLVELVHIRQKQAQEIQHNILNTPKRVFVPIKQKCESMRTTTGTSSSPSGDSEGTARGELPERIVSDLTEYGAGVDYEIGKFRALIQHLKNNEGKCLTIVK